MVEFARYYIDFIRQVFANIVEFFRSIFEAFAIFFVTNVGQYFKTLSVASQQFTIIDWVIGFIILIVNLALIVFLVLKIYQWTSKYIRFVGREIEKDELLEEISFLNQKTVELVDERNKILALKVSNLGVAGIDVDNGSSDGLGDEDDENKATGPSRFV